MNDKAREIYERISDWYYRSACRHFETIMEGLNLEQSKCTVMEKTMLIEGRDSPYQILYDPVGNPLGSVVLSSGEKEQGAKLTVMDTEETKVFVETGEVQ